jgi:alkylhydroperoxidase family enzyme
MDANDVGRLREAGFDDRAVHDAFQIAAYFNYINRVCDGLGVDLEDFMPEKRAAAD